MASKNKTVEDITKKNNPRPKTVPGDRPTPRKLRHCPKSFSNETSADVEIQNLKPSKDIIVYYQQKIERLNKENAEMQEKVEKCMAACDFSTQLEQELIARNEEISILQRAVSDLQVYVYQERQQSLRLYAENDQLRVRELEDRKKVDLLLTLCGKSESDLQIFVSQSESGFFVPQIIPPRLKKFKEKLSNTSGKDKCTKHKTACVASDCNHLLQAQMLAAQLEEQTQVARDHIQCLLKDRELSRKECQYKHDKLQSKISSLVTRLKLTQDNLCSATSELLTSQESYRLQEDKWLKQKEMMEHNLAFYINELGGIYPNHPGYTISGSGTCSKKRTGDISSLKDKLREQESLVTLYRNQSLLIEEELKKVKVQADNGNRVYKEKIQKLSSQIIYLRNKFNDLDRRRYLDAEGFRNDIKMLRTRIQNLEKSVKKLGHKLTVRATKACDKGTQHSEEPSREQVIRYFEDAAEDSLISIAELRRNLRIIKNKIQEIEAAFKEES